MTGEAPLRRRRAFRIGYGLCGGSLAVSLCAAVVNVTITERFRWWFSAVAILAALAGFGLLRYGLRPLAPWSPPPMRSSDTSPPAKGRFHDDQHG